MAETITYKEVKMLAKTIFFFDNGGLGSFWEAMGWDWVESLIPTLFVIAFVVLVFYCFKGVINYLLNTGPLLGLVIMVAALVIVGFLGMLVFQATKAAGWVIPAYSATFNEARDNIETGDVTRPDREGTPGGAPTQTGDYLICGFDSATFHMGLGGSSEVIGEIAPLTRISVLQFHEGDGYCEQTDWGNECRRAKVMPREGTFEDQVGWIHVSRLGDRVP